MIVEYRYPLATGELVAGSNNCDKTKVFDAIQYTKDAVSFLTGINPQLIEILRVIDNNKILWAINKEEMGKRFTQ